MSSNCTGFWTTCTRTGPGHAAPEKADPYRAVSQPNVSKRKARQFQWAMNIGILLSSIMLRVTPPKIVCCQRG
ncbi:UNVERIFIED_ORG: hypothetical protein GGI57_001158 [Rhizobium aethiopicum]